MKYCSICGKEINDEAVICTGCGCMVERPKNINKQATKMQPIEIFGLVCGIIAILSSIINALGFFANIYLFDLLNNLMCYTFSFPALGYIAILTFFLQKKSKPVGLILGIVSVVLNLLITGIGLIYYSTIVL